MQSKYGLNESLEILELSHNSTYKDAKRAYHTLIQKWHPDRYEQFPPLQSHAVEMTQKLNAAFEVLAKVLPEECSMTEQAFEDSFGYTAAADWSAYYSAATAEEEEEFEEEIEVTFPQKEHAALRGIKAVFNAVTAPFKLLTDMVVFIIFDKPAIPLAAGAVLYGEFVTQSSNLLLNF